MMRTIILLALVLITQGVRAEDKFEKIEFASSDGLMITADLYMPHESKKTPFLVLCHQAGWSRGEYRELAPKFNAMGFNCMAIDQRSGGAVNGVANETAQRAKEKGKGGTYLDARPDIVAALRYARKSYAERALIAVGSSYSSALVLEIVGTEKNIANGVMSFAPGEYFQRFGKSATYVKAGASKLKVPTFVTSAKGEAGQWKNIFSAIPGKKKHMFLPETEGNHGARALWKQFEDSGAYWKAVETFLDRYFPRKKAKKKKK